MLTVHLSFTSSILKLQINFLGYVCELYILKRTNGFLKASESLSEFLNINIDTCNTLVLCDTSSWKLSIFKTFRIKIRIILTVFLMIHFIFKFVGGP